jgi:hypothetical protein
VLFALLRSFMEVAVPAKQQRGGGRLSAVGPDVSELLTVTTLR